MADRIIILAALALVVLAPMANAEDAGCKAAAAAYAQSRRDAIFENAGSFAETSSVPRQQLHETRLTSALVAQLGDLMALSAMHCPTPAEPMALNPDFDKEVQCATALMQQKADAVTGKKPGALAACKP